MIRRTALVLTSIFLAGLILLVSVMRSASTKYAFSNSMPQGTYSPEDVPQISYDLVHPGDILPGDFMWMPKAVHDRAWLTVTTDPARKAEIYLLLADKRLRTAQILCEQGDYDMAVSTLTKAEKYLERAVLQEELARRQGSDTTGFLNQAPKSILKHREVIMKMAKEVPDDARQVIIETENYPIKLYEKIIPALNENKVSTPPNPFEN